jgi:hypothetical protein
MMMHELEIRKYLTMAFAVSLFVTIIIRVEIFSVIMNSRAWVGLWNAGITKYTSFEEDVGRGVTVQMIFYMILTFLGLTMAYWILKDREIVGRLNEQNMRLHKEIDEIKTKENKK